MSLAGYLITNLCSLFKHYSQLSTVFPGNCEHVKRNTIIASSFPKSRQN